MIKAHGLDVSRWDVKPIDFSAYASKFDFISVKVSEGTYVDPLFREQWQAAKGFVPRFAYHFFRPGYDPKLAARRCFEVLQPDMGEIEPALDIEVTDGRADTLVRAKQWVDEFYRLSGKFPIIYSTRYFLTENGIQRRNSFGGYIHSWASKCKLWLAEWPYDSVSSMAGYTEKGDVLREVLINEVLSGKRLIGWPKLLAPFRSVDIWQWTSRAKTSLIPGYYMGMNPKHKEVVDLNYWNMPKEEFLATYLLPHMVEEVPNPLTRARVIASAGLNLRLSPAGTVTSVLPYGTIVTLTTNASGPWVEISAVNGVARGGWVHSNYIVME